MLESMIHMVMGLSNLIQCLNSSFDLHTTHGSSTHAIETMLRTTEKVFSLAHQNSLSSSQMLSQTYLESTFPPKLYPGSETSLQVQT